MELLDSRRLTGPSLLQDEPGAILEISGTGPGIAEAVATWRDHATELLAAVGWSRCQCNSRRHAHGASLAITAPIDALYAACEVNEAAWESVAAVLHGASRPDCEAVAARLRQQIEGESMPAIGRLAEAAARHGVSCLHDDEQVSVGLGEGSRSWPNTDIPDPDAIDWREIYDVPRALVTGTNGKTTTVRMLGAMAQSAGIVAGNTSTDGVQLDGHFILRGDYTGGEGARTLLRNRSVQLAVLETARGGMLRRGLPIARADAAVVTNIGTDHLGEYGVVDLQQLAEVKLIVARAVREPGTLVANADDPVLAPAAERACRRVTWVAVEPDGTWLTRQHSSAWIAHRGEIGLVEHGDFQPWVGVSEIAPTLGGAAVHNVYNALGALAVGHRLRLPREAMVDGLCHFESNRATNPGRGNLFELGGVRAYADFAHNPEGLRTVLAVGDRLPIARKLLILGQAGDRGDAAIDALADVAAAAKPDRILIKQMREHLRGRQAGTVVTRLRDRLCAQGYPATGIEIIASEFEAVCRALAWARPGDLLFLLLHAQRTRVLDLLETLATGGWSPGDPLPPIFKAPE